LRTVKILVALVAVAAVFAAGLLAWSLWNDKSGDSGAERDATPADATPPRETTERAFGEVFDANPLAIRVVSAGPANLPAQAQDPDEGYSHVVVAAVAKNVGDSALPINGTPYSVYNTELETGGEDYPGALISGVVGVVRDGTIPAGDELTLRYLFEVPEGSQEATFAWPPAGDRRDQPTLVVPIADISVRTP